MLHIPSVIWHINTGVQLHMDMFCIFSIQPNNQYEICEYLISAMTLLIISATSTIGATMIESIVDDSAGCPCGQVPKISTKWHHVESSLHNRYHCCFSPIILVESFCTPFNPSTGVFPHKIGRGNPMTSFSVSGWRIIATARCEILAKTHFIHHLHSLHNQSSNPSPYTEKYGPNLVCQNLGSGLVWNCILVAWNTVRC
jgi:hypothetical protein